VPKRQIIQKIYPTTEKDCNLVYSQFRPHGAWTIVASHIEDLISEKYTHLQITTETKQYLISFEDIFTYGKMWAPKHYITKNPIVKWVFPVNKMLVTSLEKTDSAQLVLF
jgi:hypothetical protein